MFNPNDHHPIEDFFGLKPEDADASKKESLKHTITNGKSVWSRWRLLPKVLSLRERYTIGILVLVIVGSLVAIPIAAYYHYTVAVPAVGGSFSEGIVGQPRLINPVLSQTSDVDRDITELVYAGLLKYNPAGNLVPDLAQSYDISSDGLNYTVYLKPNEVWQDGQPITADDIVYTIQTIQDADYASPARVDWENVTVKAVNDTTIIFTLPAPYAQFLNNLTIGILPKHIWADIQPINFAVSDYNLKPIGSGPYMFSKLRKDTLGTITDYILTANPQYSGDIPYISQIDLKFYNSESDMITAYNNDEIDNLSTVSPAGLTQIKFPSRLNIYNVNLPRYFATFFNQTQSDILADKNVRLALNYGTDKQSLIASVEDGKAVAVNSPLVDSVIGIAQASDSYAYDFNQATQILAADGWTAGSDGILQKKGIPLAITITTSTFPELNAIANVLKDQWSKLGIQVTINALPAAQLQDAIRDRSYQALLFGEILSPDPDPFSLWDSSQVQDPGLNLALYSNKDADQLLEDARQTLDPTVRVQKYDQFQNIVIADAPAVFLYSPLYIYPQSTKIKGFTSTLISVPSDRFDDIEHWYIDTTRVHR